MSDDTFTRRFHGDRTDLAKVGIEIRVLTGADAVDAAETQLYLLKEEDFRLPEVGLHARGADGTLDSPGCTGRPLRVRPPVAAGAHGHLPRSAGRVGATVRPAAGGPRPRRGCAQGRQAACPPGGRGRPRTDGVLLLPQFGSRRCADGAHGRPLQPFLHPGSLVRRRSRSPPRRRADLPSDEDRRTCQVLDRKEPRLLRSRRTTTAPHTGHVLPGSSDRWRGPRPSASATTSLGTSNG